MDAAVADKAVEAEDMAVAVAEYTQHSKCLHSDKAVGVAEGVVVELDEERVGELAVDTFVEVELHLLVRVLHLLYPILR
jgi:hypothetical protein